MIAAFQFKLYPTEEQERLLLETLETLRHLYNNALGERIDAYKHEQRNVSFYDQANQLPHLKKRALFLANVHAHLANDCMKRLQRAYENFFRRVKLGQEKLGFPRFKSIGRYRSFTFPEWGNGANLI